MAYSKFYSLEISRSEESSEMYMEDDELNMIMRERFMDRSNAWRWDGGIEESGESIVLNNDGWESDDIEDDDELIVLVGN